MIRKILTKKRLNLVQIFLKMVKYAHSHSGLKAEKSVI